MATAKKKTVPKKAGLKASTVAKVVSAERPAAKAVRAKTAYQPSLQQNIRTQVFVTLFALLSVIFAAMAYMNY